MKLTKCSKAGHFYDGERFAECPYCANPSMANEDLTEPANKKPEHDATTVNMDSLLRNSAPAAKEKESPLREAVKTATLNNADDRKTIGFFESTMGLEPVVGWLVCVDGPHFGQDFRLKAGRNFIGRAPDMDVIIARDETVSRERHAIIVYEPKKNLFIVQPGSSKELSYLNDNVVLTAIEAKAYDTLLVGKTKLILVPCCSEAFRWDMLKPESEEKK